MSKSKEDVLVLTVARLESSRIPRKMVKPFAGTTLVDILYGKLTQSDVIPQKNIVASLYDNELIEIAEKYDISIFHRSRRSAEENERLDVIHEWVNYLNYPYVIFVSACNPLLQLETIERFYLEFLDSDRDGMFGVFETRQYYWDKNFTMVKNYNDTDKIFNTKTVDPMYEAAHSLYASKTDFINDGYMMDNKFPPDIDLFVMDEIEAFDIDYPWQFRVGEELYKELS